LMRPAIATAKAMRRRLRRRISFLAAPINACARAVR
jgi:hypothetical protein